MFSSIQRDILPSIWSSSEIKENTLGTPLLQSNILREPRVMRYLITLVVLEWLKFVVNFLHENDLPWTVDFCAEVVRHRFLVCFNWLTYSEGIHIFHLCEEDTLNCQMLYKYLSPIRSALPAIMQSGSCHTVYGNSAAWRLHSIFCSLLASTAQMLSSSKISCSIPILLAPIISLGQVSEAMCYEQEDTVKQKP